MISQSIKRLRKRKRIYYLNNGRCYICKKPIEFDEMTLDHIVPRVDQRAIKNNLACCCFDCNAMKGYCEYSIKSNGYIRGNPDLIIRAYSYFNKVLKNDCNR